MKSVYAVTLLLVLTIVVSACAPAAAPAPEPTAVPTAVPAPTAVPTPAPQDIVDIAVADGRFTTLVAAVQAAGLVDTLKGAGPFTVFAPTDDAFAKLPAGTVDGLLQDLPKLKDILLYHVVAGKVMAADAAKLTSADTVLGKPITIKAEGGKVMINDATVVIADIEASNGVIHVIDTVILPPAEEAAPAPQDIVDIAEKVLSFLSALNSNDTDTARALMSDYIQHNPFIPTGPDAILSLFPVIEQNNTQVNTIRVFQDGNYVVAHNFWENAAPFGAEEVVTFDVFRFDEDGLIAEHWDALMPNTPPNPSGRTLIDGATEVTDLDQTEANKAIVVQLFDVIVNGTPEEVGAAVTENFLPDYLQHSPTVADGIPAIFEAFGREQWVYTKNHMVIGEGNFVLSISEGTAKGVHVAFYDLFRFENGKVAEHWDVIQAIPTEGLANDNGMFGFK